MRVFRGAVALIASAALVSGCFGYNRSAKRWAYVADSVLVLGGGAAIADDLRNKEAPCTGDNCLYHSSIHGEMVAGVMLVVAGITGMLVNATRTEVKSSR